MQHYTDYRYRTDFADFWLYLFFYGQWFFFYSSHFIYFQFTMLCSKLSWLLVHF